MKVLLISGEFPPMVGGVGDYTACLASTLQKLGLQTSVLTSRKAAASQGVWPFPVLALAPGWSFQVWGWVRRALELQPADIVHIQYQAAAYGLHPAVSLLPLYLRLRSPDIKTLVTFHDLRVPYIFPKAGPLREGAVRLLARRCQGIICAEEADIHTLSQWGLKSSPHLIPIGSNIPVEAPWEGGFQSGDSLVLGYFGLLNRSKGVETLLRAYRQLRQKGLSVRLTMIGADLGDSDPSNATYAEELRTLVKDLELGEAVSWTGSLSRLEVSRALRVLDLCVLPYSDGASFRRGTLMAALAHGLPILTTRPLSSPLTGYRLTDGENCRLVSPGDPEALAQAIQELAGAPLLRKSLAQGALALSRCFTWDEIGRKTFAVYEGVLHARWGRG